MCDLVLFKAINERFSRWLHNPRINVQKLYSSLTKLLFCGVGSSADHVIEDNSMLWDEYQ